MTVRRIDQHGERPVGGELTTSAESREVAWCDRGSVLRLAMSPAQRRRIRYFLEFRGEPYLE